jgi:hypothetical protein
VNVLLRLAAAILFLLAALGFFSRLVHLTTAHALGLAAFGLLALAIASIIERTPRAG